LENVLLEKEEAIQKSQEAHEKSVNKVQWINDFKSINDKNLPTFIKSMVYSPVSHHLSTAVQFDKRRIYTVLISIQCKIFTNSHSCTEKWYCLTIERTVMCTPNRD